MKLEATLSFATLTIFAVACSDAERVPLESSAPFSDAAVPEDVGIASDASSMDAGFDVQDAPNFVPLDCAKLKTTPAMRDIGISIPVEISTSTPAHKLVWSGNDGSLIGSATADAKGFAVGRWLPFTPTATASVNGCPLTGLIGTAKRSNARSIYFDWIVPAKEPSEIINEVMAHTAPPNTYYTAMQFVGGYAGIQPANIEARRVLFSVWDILGGAKAVLLDAAASTCGNFGGEGTGIQCWYAHPVVIGSNYRFRLAVAYGAAFTDYTMYFSPTGAAEVKLGTIRHGVRAAYSTIGAFAEDYGPKSASCFAAGARKVSYRNTSIRSGGALTPLKSATFVKGGLAPDNVDCDNLGAWGETGALTMSTGGTTDIAPEAVGKVHVVK